MGADITTHVLAELVMSVVKFKGDDVFEPSMPEGTQQKLLNVERMKALGWQVKVSLRDGASMIYNDFQKKISEIMSL